MASQSIKKNITLSVVAQLISFLVGFILNLVTPKYIPESSYAFWQIYALYASYVGLLHFGLLDGIVLRYSQYDYDQLNKPLIQSQFRVLLIITGMISLMLSCGSLFLFSGNTSLIVFLVGLAIVIKNIYTYTSFTFQITNRIKYYVLLVIINRLLYGVFVSALLITKHYEFYYYCIADVLSDFIATVVCSFFNKGLYFGAKVTIADAWSECKANVSAGVLLLIANWSAMFLTSSSKLVIQWKWDELTFGKTAFAFSIANLFLQFINAASIVLFPALKRIAKNDLPDYYVRIRNKITPFLFIVLLFYYPGIYALKLWVPNYSQSFGYLGILFPMVVFSSKVNLLTNNYLKTYRKEKVMSYINLASIAIGFSLYLLFAYVFNNLAAVLYSVIIVLAIQSYVSERYVSKIIKISFNKDYIVEIFVIIVFWISINLNQKLYGFGLYMVSIICFWIIARFYSQKQFGISRI